MNADLAKVLAKINKKFGEDTVVLGSEIVEVPHRFTSGSLSLDVALGGGWPANQWHELVGEASNGKTAIALKTIAANQKKDPNFTTVWVAAEEWVPGYAELCGVDPSRVYVYPHWFLQPKTRKKWKRLLLDAELYSQISSSVRLEKHQSVR
jgi:recombination protein RecA